MSDERLTKALAYANYKSTMVNQRENLKLRFQNAMIHAHNGGIFMVSPALMSMVDLLIRQGQTSAVLIDDKGIPIMVPELTTFLEDISSTYAEASNDYYAAWEQTRKARSVAALVDKK